MAADSGFARDIRSGASPSEGCRLERAGLPTPPLIARYQMDDGSESFLCSSLPAGPRGGRAMAGAGARGAVSWIRRPPSRH